MALPPHHDHLLVRLRQSPVVATNVGRPAQLSPLSVSSTDPADEKTWEVSSPSRSSTISALSGHMTAMSEDSCSDVSSVDGREANLDRPCVAKPAPSDGQATPEPAPVSSPASQQRSASQLGFFVFCTLTVVSGCACQAPYELMHSRDRGCGHLLSLVEHIFGTLASGSAFLQSRRGPWVLHISLAVANVAYSVLVNLALTTELPPMVLITMKNGNLAASMLLGACVLGHRYNRGQCFAVIIVTAGLALTSISGGAFGRLRLSQDGNGSFEDAGSATFGLLCVLGALLSRSACGLLQEHACRKHAVPVTELLLYRSMLGLPAILLYWQSIVRHSVRWSGLGAVPGVGPTMWLLLVANVSLDYLMKVCISQVIGRASSLTATLVLTFQRFVSFVISATWLGVAPAGVDLWLGAVAVLVGTVCYAQAAEHESPTKAGKDD